MDSDAQEDADKNKDEDRLSFSLSEEEADDTADSLDIKPPQAAVAHKRPRHKKEKCQSREFRRQHGHSSRDSSSHRKSHHSAEDRRREHKDKEVVREIIRDREVGPYREKEHRDKRLSHRERREQRERGEHDRSKERVRREEQGYYREEKMTLRDLHLEDAHRTADQLLQDLRGKLLDKRNIREGRSQTDEPERKRSRKGKRDGEERVKEEMEVETPKEKADRIERDERRAKLLDAEREMALRKEVSRRELEARRERHHLEKEKARMLKEIAKKHKMQEEEDDDDEEVQMVEASDNSEKGSLEEEEDSTGSSSVQEPSEVDDTDDDHPGGTPESVPPLEKSPVADRSEGEPLEEEDEEEVHHMEEEEERQEENEVEMNANNHGKYSPEVAESQVVLKEEDLLPPYLPAIQGCRSVEEFQCLNRIEEGTYGVVYRARDKRTKDIVALKRLKMEKEREGFPITSLREINTLLKAQHPNIVTVREIVVGSNMDKIFIVMDYVEHDLKSLMETMKQKKQVFVAGEVKCLTQQLLRAVAHLHDNWILHRDLKTSNLLLSHKGILKVGDFGLAREYGSPLKAYTPVVVTLWYRAPELLLQSKEYSTAIDMWSVGCIFGELCQMEALFSGRSEMDQLNRIFKELGTPNEKVWPGYNKLPALQRVTFAEYPVNNLKSRFASKLSDFGIGLMNRFLTYDPAQRVTAEEALKHEYFKESPVAIDPAMFPTWPAKSELTVKKVNNSPKPPSGGKEYKQLGDTDDDVSTSGFHMGAGERRVNTAGAGFSLKF